jgi:Flp pilus assembly protein TadG
MRHGRPKGQALVELALVLPIFLVMLLAIFDLGRVIWAKNALENAAREGTRFAIVHGDSIGQTCPVGPSGSVHSTPPSASTACPHPAPSKQSVYDAARAFAFAGGVRPATCVSTDTVTTGPCIAACYGSACSGDTDTIASTIRGTSVTVRVTSDIRLVVPALLGFSSFSVVGFATMLVNS